MEQFYLIAIYRRPFPLDYRYEGDLPLLPGTRVRVPLGTKEYTGIVVQALTQPNVPPEKLKAITAVLDDTPIFPAKLLTLCSKVANYYHCGLGELLFSVLPPAFKKGDPLETKLPELPTLAEQNTTLILSPEQQIAAQTISQQANHFKVFVLAGQTGSGKTEVYIEALRPLLAKGGYGLILLPEIALTPQTLARIQSQLPYPILSYHSGLTEKKKKQAWLQIASGTVRVIIGTRSAVFLPFPKLDLIIMDEEHDTAYKQQDGIRYWARHVALFRGQLEQCPVVLTSATPTLESLHQVQLGHYTALSLPQRAGLAAAPTIQVVDLRHQKLECGLSPILLNQMRVHLAAGNQVLLFRNQRGYAPIWMCYECGWMADCNSCDSYMVQHKGTTRLYCHHCGKSKAAPTQCPKCKHTGCQPVGYGTQKLEEYLTELFPDIPLVRIDRDSTSGKGSLETKLESIKNQEAQLIIGTQMMSKGHDFAHLTLVGILDIDGGLFSADFRALERVGQLITQVSGRAGRREQQGQVILQSCHPDHPLLQILLTQGYSAFAAALLEQRQAAQLPPFAYQAILRCEGRKYAVMYERLVAIKECLKIPGVYIYGPLEPTLSKMQGRFRLNLLLHSEQRALLKQAVTQLKYLLTHKHKASDWRWLCELDPLEA